MAKKTIVGIAIALALLSGVNWWKSSQSVKREAASAGNPAGAVQQAALTPPQMPELPQTARGTRAYAVRTSLGVKELDCAVKESGARIVSYLSHAGAIVEATDEARAKLRECRGVKSVEVCSRASKFSPMLRERLAKLAPDASLRVKVALVNAVDAATVGACIASAGGRVTSWPNPDSRFAWMGAEMPAERVDALADLAEVKWIEPQGTLKYANDTSVRTEELDVRRAWDDVSGLGLTGAGQVIGHADTGLDLGDITRLEPEFAGHVKAIYDHTKGGGMRDTQGHGTHTAGSIVGQGIASLGGKYRGTAYGATLVHQSLGYELAGAPDDMNTLFAETYRDGARIHSDSWGDENPLYDSCAQSLDEFVWSHPDFLPVFSSGNSAHLASPTVKAPALAYNVITIGAADHAGEVTYFSSRGLADENDERIKPDVLAPGFGIVSVQSMAIRNPTACDDPAAGTRYCAASGSSMATPLAAGSLALMREWYLREKGKSPSAAMLMAMAVGGAATRRGTGEVSGASGWGSMNVAATLAPTNGVAVRLRDEFPKEDEHASIVERFLVTNSSERLVFSLAWLDYPHDPLDSGLLTDYDLAVFAPDGTRHWPNGGTDGDHVNTRETVVVTNATPGIWVVTVSAPDSSHPGGAVALYACGAFAADEAGAETNVWHVKDGESIQSAVDQAKNGDAILVDAGTFAPFAASNKVLTICGAGRDRTVIRGDGASRVVSLSLPGDPGGLVLESVTIENGCDDMGGGICGGTLRHATIRNCKARYCGGGACEAVLDRCVVSNCTVVARSTPEEFDASEDIFSGGGVFESTLYNCLIANCGIDYDVPGDDAPVGGGGAARSKLANTTVVRSWIRLVDWDAYTNDCVKCGAVYDCAAQNILVSVSTVNLNGIAYFLKHCELGHTYLSSHVAVVGTNAFVHFASGDYHLSSNAVSAIDAGCTNYVAHYPSATDLGGANRVMGNSVDLGCYESPYTNSLPPGVDLPNLKETKSGPLVGFAMGVDDAEKPEVGASMIGDAWSMTAFEKALAGADAERSELVCGEVGITDFLEAAERIVDAVHSNDVVLLSVSTHGSCTEDPTNGVRIAGSSNLLVMYDKTYIWPSNVVAFAERLEAKGAKLVQVHDSCYSAGFVEMTGLPGVSATTCEETSQGPADGGLFTSAFLEAWRHPSADADLNGDGVLSLYELAVATQRTYRGYPETFYGTECCIYKPEELAKVAVRVLPKEGEEDPVCVITDRMPPVRVSQDYHYRLRAAGASNLTWSAQTELPAGLTLEADGLVHGYPAWSPVTNFQVRVEADDGRWAETNIVLSGQLAAANSRPRLVSVSVPQGVVARRRDDGDWTVQVEIETDQNPTNEFGYSFTVSTRYENTTLTNEQNETGVFTVPAALLAAWPDVYVSCAPLSATPEIGISEKCAVWFIRTDVPFPASRAGVCSWSWATNMTTILTEMDTMGVQQMQLSLVPWVKPLYGIEYPASLRETFGKGEAGDVFLSISNRILRGEISVLSTMISFPFDRWTNFAAISNSNGIVCNIDTNSVEGTSVSTTDPLGLAAWTVNSNLIDQAAAMTRQLGVDYITTEIGYLDKVMMDHETNANDNCNIGMERLYEAHRLCAKHGVRLLFESGQYSGARTMELIDIYTNRYANASFENDYGLTVNDIGINYDVANHLIYANDNPTNAFTAMRGRIAQIHVKDTYEDLAERTAKCGFAGDVKWGTADVSGKYATLAFLKDEGYAGNLLVEHEYGEDRVGDIKAALQAILLENNDDGSPWIAPQAMAADTMNKCCTAALKANGFSSSVASALGKVQLYSSFTNWATGNGFEPTDLVSKSGVVLAAALAADAPPESAGDVTLAIEGISPGDKLTTLDICYELADHTPVSIDTALLKAAIGIEGATNLTSTAFSSDNVSVTTNSFPELGRMRVGVKPSVSGSQTGNAFFYRAVAR